MPLGLGWGRFFLYETEFVSSEDGECMGGCIEFDDTSLGLGGGTFLAGDSVEPRTPWASRRPPRIPRTAYREEEVVVASWEHHPIPHYDPFSHHVTHQMKMLEDEVIPAALDPLPSSHSPKDFFLNFLSSASSNERTDFHMCS